MSSRTPAHADIRTLGVYYHGPHSSDGHCPCLHGRAARVTLQRHLFALVFALYGRARLADALLLGEHEGLACPVVHRYAGPGGVESYRLAVGGREVEVPAMLVVEREQVDLAARPFPRVER